MLSQAQRRAQGAAAEDRFRAWLDRCRLPHIYVEQSPLTFPETLHGKIKRPDFLVGIPTTGTIAVDMKAKRIYADTIIIDADEHRTLANSRPTSTPASGSPASRPTSRMSVCSS